MAYGDLDRIGAMSERSGVKIPLIKMSRKPDVICVVSELDRSVNGFSLYRLCPDKIIIKHLIVDEEFRRMGVATGLVMRLVSKMSSKRSLVEARVSEYNVDAQLFFRSLSFRAEEIARGDESQYVFRKRLLI